MKNKNNILKIIFNHLKEIHTHRFWVSYYGKICGLSNKQIFIHDLSEYSYIEFSEYVRYYFGNKPPRINCIEANGYSRAYLHHIGRNPHHYEYWMNNYDTGATPIRMPYKYAVEMLCDILAIGHVFAINSDKEFMYIDGLKYFIAKIDSACGMHNADKKFVYLVLRNLKNIDNIPISNDRKTMRYILQDKFLNKNILKDLYYYSEHLSDEDFNSIRDSVEHPPKERGVTDVLRAH